MDMQNVSNLQMPEGAVRTIHDKNNRLLWGAVGYDTKYAGDTYQQTYSGKNMLPMVDGTAANSGITLTIDKGILTVNGTSNSAAYFKLTNGIISNSGNTIPASWLDESVANWNGKTLSIKLLSGTAPSAGSAFRFFTNTTSHIWQSYPNISRETTFNTSEDISCFTLFVNPNITFNNAKYELQLEEGSTATSFEPYVGGIPSPNPDYPQEVQTVTGEQTVEVHGKNLLGLDNFSGSFSSNQYTEFGNILDIKSAYGIAASLDVTLNSFKYTKTSQYDSNQKWDFKGLQPNTNYTVSCNYSITSASSTSTYLFGAYRAVSGNSLTQSFTTNGNGEKEFTLQFYGATQNDIIELTNLMVEQGSTATTYEPYQSQSYTISLGSLELCLLGNYQDYIYKSGNDWYVHKETNSLTVTSSMSGLGKSGTSANNAFYLTSQFGDIDRSGMGQGASSTTVTPSYSKYFTTKSANEVFNSDTVGMAFDIYTGTLTDFRVGFGLSSSMNTLNLFKTWLDNNPLKVYYPLATPADTQITDTALISQLNAVHEWMTRYGYNSVVTGNLPIIIDRTNL